jgi:heme/copper-type cytochrome/quinol oxidase subunit 4
MAKARSFLATIVGYVLAAVLAYLAFRMFVGTVYWLIRTVIVIVAIGGLAALYLKLKTPSTKP